MTVSAKVITDSISPHGIRLTTLELEYPRIIHSELMTHRMFSRNSASSRAIPVSKVIELVESNPAMPVHWGKNQPGMQAKEELDPTSKEVVRELWLKAAKQSISVARAMNDLGAHKQVINRILEPFQHMKVVVTATEWANWDWLRYHEDADPTIYALAKEIKIARDNSTPNKLLFGQWHLPYVIVSNAGMQLYKDEKGNFISLEEAKMISASCCAQTSYRKSDSSLEKAEDIFKKLVESEPCHASPVEHQAICIDISKDGGDNPHWGYVTHTDREGMLWSANFQGWGQYRQVIPDNAKYG